MSYSRPAFVAEMLAEVPAGRCIFCEGRVRSNGRPRVICQSPDCTRLYAQAYGVERRARKGRKPREKKW